MTDPEHIHALPKGYRLENYDIDRVLGQGGLGITYLAEDRNLQTSLVIKECFPDYLVMREPSGAVVPKEKTLHEDLERIFKVFSEEGDAWAEIDHPALVHIRQTLRANGTVYLAMEYLQGESLRSLLERKKKLTAEQTLDVVRPLLDGLETLHDHLVLHRDIQPCNIFIRDDGEPVLFDFGSARRVKNIRDPVGTIMSRYEPKENYHFHGHMGPCTDIYSLGAVAYHCLTGKPPLYPPEREWEDSMIPAVNAAAGWAPGSFLQAVDWALTVKHLDRPQSIAEWRRSFEDAETGEIIRSADDRSADRSWLRRLSARLGTAKR